MRKMAVITEIVNLLYPLAENEILEDTKNSLSSVKILL